MVRWNVGGLTPTQPAMLLRNAVPPERLLGVALFGAAPGRDARGITEQAGAALLLALLAPWLFEAVTA